MKPEMCSIVAVSPLVSVFREQVKQLKQLVFSAAAIELGEEYEEYEKAEREGNCFRKLKICDRSVARCTQMYILIFAFRGCYCFVSFT